MAQAQSAELSEIRDLIHEILRDFLGHVEPTSDQTEYVPTTISRFQKLINNLDSCGEEQAGAELQEETEIASLKLELGKVKAAMEENKSTIKQLDIKIPNMMSKFQQFLNEISKEKEELKAENRKLKKDLVKKEADLRQSNNSLKKGVQKIKELEEQLKKKESVSMINHKLQLLDLDFGNGNDPKNADLRSSSDLVKTKDDELAELALSKKKAEKLQKMIEDKENSIAKQEMDLVNAKRFIELRTKNRNGPAGLAELRLTKIQR